MSSTVSASILSVSYFFKFQFLSGQHCPVSGLSSLWASGERIGVIDYCICVFATLGWSDGRAALLGIKEQCRKLCITKYQPLRRVFSGKPLFSPQEYQIIPLLETFMCRIKVSRSTLFLIKKIIPPKLTPCVSLFGFKSPGEQIHALSLVEIALLPFMFWYHGSVRISDCLTSFYTNIDEKIHGWAKCLKVSRSVQGFL